MVKAKIDAAEASATAPIADVLDSLIEHPHQSHAAGVDRDSADSVAEIKDHRRGFVLAPAQVEQEIATPP